VPMGMPLGDVTGDGIVAGGAGADFVKADAARIAGIGSYSVEMDTDLDGVITTADTAAVTARSGRSLGRGKLSEASVAWRVGWRGMEWVDAIAEYVTQSNKLYLPNSAIHARSSSTGLCFQQPPLPIIPPPTYPEFCAEYTVTLEACLTCCMSRDESGLEQSHVACAEQCHKAKWDPRLIPERNPAHWGDCKGGSIGNCLRYAACDPGPRMPSDDPLFYQIHQKGPSGCHTCASLAAYMTTTYGATENKGGPCPPRSYAIALMVFDQVCLHRGASVRICDFHFFRSEPSGVWTDKPGCEPVNPSFAEPLTEFRSRDNGPCTYYNIWCGYMCVPY